MTEDQKPRLACEVLGTARRHGTRRRRRMRYLDQPAELDRRREAKEAKKDPMTAGHVDR